MVVHAQGSAFAGVQHGRARIVVFGNEKGGTGKSTLAIHLAVAMLHAGYRVATVDLDARQQTLTRFIDNRRATAREVPGGLPGPQHVAPPQAGLPPVAEGEAYRWLAGTLAAVERSSDVVVVDTPGSDDRAARVAHGLADTLVTPTGDSFLDLDALGRTPPARSPYARDVVEAHRRRRHIDGTAADWIVARNRFRPDADAVGREAGACLRELSAELAFRIADGLSDRPVYQCLFPFGLTALDPAAESADGAFGRLELLAARHEIRTLLSGLRLPPAGAAAPRSAEPGRLSGFMSRPVDPPDLLVP